MSFSDQPSYGNWRHILGFLLAFLLFFANLFVLAVWLMSFWDPSTDEYRATHPIDFFVMPISLLLTYGIFKMFVRFVVRD